MSGFSYYADLQFMQLRLADYGEKKEKFERFLELGKDFIYGGDFVNVKPRYACGDEFFDKDEKDPLNRFNGLFDGRTYGDGRFVLIKDNDYTIVRNETRTIKGKTIKGMKITGEFIIGNLIESPELWEKVR